MSSVAGSGTEEWHVSHRLFGLNIGNITLDLYGIWNGQQWAESDSMRVIKDLIMIETLFCSRVRGFRGCQEHA